MLRAKRRRRQPQLHPPQRLLRPPQINQQTAMKLFLGKALNFQKYILQDSTLK